MTDRWTERLSEYVDGDLNDRDREALEAHLPTCATCRETVAELRDLLSQAHALEPSPPGRTVGTGLNDGWLWVKTRFDLAAADDLRDSTINVDVDNAVVTLSGTVATAAQSTKASQVAKAVEGVKGVKNMLKVSAGNTNAATANKNANKNANK